MKRQHPLPCSNTSERQEHKRRLMARAAKEVLNLQSCVKTMFVDQKPNGLNFWLHSATENT